jgi:hypothetical protein
MRGAIVAAIALAMNGAPLVLGGGGLWAKLPPPTDAEKAAAAAKAAKAAEAAKKNAELLNRSMDLTVEKYKKLHAGKGTGAPAAAAPTAAKK